MGNKHSKTCHVIAEGKQLVFPTTPTIFTIQTPEFKSYASLQARKNTPSGYIVYSDVDDFESEPDVSLQLLGMSGYQNRCLRDSGLGSCSNNTSPKYMNIEGTDNNYRNFDVSNSEDSPSSSDSEDISFHCQKEHLTLNRKCSKVGLSTTCHVLQGGSMPTESDSKFNDTARKSELLHFEDIEDQSSTRDDVETEDTLSSLNTSGIPLNYYDGHITDRMKDPLQKNLETVAPIHSSMYLAPIERPSSAESVSVNSVSAEDTNECIISANSDGCNFVCNTYPLSGSIPEGAIPHGESRQLHIKRYQQDVYQPVIESGNLVSDIYECTPHAVRFDKPILLQISCAPGRSARDGTVRRYVIYSNTPPGETQNWVKIIADDHDDISTVFTGTLVNLFVSSFCLFGVVECNVPVKYVDMIIFGKFYPEKGMYKVTVILAQQMTDKVKLVQCGETILHYGRFIIQKPLCLVQDAKKLTLSLKMNRSDCWNCITADEEIKTHYLWNGGDWTSVFAVKQNLTAWNDKPLFQGLLNAKHNDELVECLILESPTQMMPVGYEMQLTIPDSKPCTQPVEHVQDIGGSSMSSESIIPKEIYNTESVETQSYKYLIQSNIDQTEIKKKPEDVNTIENKFTNCEVIPEKLPQHVKNHLIQVLDVKKPDGSDWKGLAQELGYGQYCGQFYTGKSGHLLTLWEARRDEKGTVDYLVKALNKIKQEPLAAFITNYKKAYTDQALDKQQIGEEVL